MVSTTMFAQGGVLDGVLAVLFDAAIKSFVLLLGAAAVAYALRGRSAAHRHLVWSLAVAGALAIPLFSSVAPALEVPIPGALARVVPEGEGLVGVLPLPEVVGRADDDAGPMGASGAAERAYEALGIGEAERAAAAELRASWLENRTRGLGLRQDAAEARLDGLERRVASLEATRPGTRSDAGSGLDPDRAQHAGVPGAGPGWRSATAATIAIWAAGAVLVLASLAAGLLRLRWIAARAERVRSGPVRQAADLVCGRLRIARSPVLLRGEAGSIPMTWGLRRPYVLLPAGAEAWPRWRLEAVLLHELGHVSRRDYLAQMAAHVACAVYWFNPLVWIAAHQMRIEREHACDDLVVAAGHDASDYADDLLRLARACRSRRPLEAVALAMARPNHLRARLLAILDPSRSRTPLSRRPALTAGGAALLIALGVSALTPSGAEAGPASGATTTEGDVAGPEGVVGGDAARPAGDVAASSGAIPEKAPDAPELAGAPGEDESVALAAPPSNEPDFVGDVPGLLQDAQVLCGPRDGEARRRASLSDDGVRTIEAEFGDCRSRVRIEGDLQFNEDFSAITRLSGGALFRIEVERDGARRRLEVRPGDGGRPAYRWSIDGREQTFDASARQWLATALLDLFRSSSYMAEERASWILARRGPAGLVAEADLMTADHAQATYLTILVRRADLSPQEVRDVIALAGRDIDSDHSLGELLIAVAERYAFDGPTQAAFLEAATSIESDHQQGRIFMTALSRGDLTTQSLDVLLRAAARSIDSDHTLGEVLTELAARYSVEPALRDPYLQAAETIDSDHTRGIVYRALLAEGSLRPEDKARVLAAAARIGSDHELSTLLIELAEEGLEGAALQRAFLDAASGIDSDYSLSQTLGAFARIDGIEEQMLIQVLVTARGIDSDHSLSELLIAFAEHHPVQGRVREAFLETLDTVQSRHEHGRVSSAIVRR